MIRVIMGKKGSGKTKQMIDMINNAVQTEHGNVVCIERGNKLTFDINYQIRLVESSQYDVANYEALKGFVSATEWYDHDGVYILIDGNCFSAGVLAPYYLRQAIDGAKLVGAPTGQGLWFPANSAWYELPNSGVSFSIGDEIVCAQQGWEDCALRPDVEVYETLEDYKAGVDTVLAWAMAD